MHIAIIETGEPPAPLTTSFPSYAGMMEQMLRPQEQKFTFSRRRAFDGDALPALADCDGLLITGSPAGVYDGHAWIDDLLALICAAADAGKPQFGICFGHQAMAKAFGGTVEKSDKGWGVGVHHYDIQARAPWMTPGASAIACTVSHQDQVITPPETAEICGGSEFCPYGLINYRHAPAASLQMHPEFDHAFAGELMRIRRGRIPGPLVDDGLASLAGRSDRAALGQWIANFFRQA